MELSREKTYNYYLIEKIVSMGKNFLIKISMGKPPNEMGNCPFASPLVTPLATSTYAIDTDLLDLCLRK